MNEQSNVYPVIIILMSFCFGIAIAGGIFTQIKNSEFQTAIDKTIVSLEESNKKLEELNKEDLTLKQNIVNKVNEMAFHLQIIDKTLRDSELKDMYLTNIKEMNEQLQAAIKSRQDQKPEIKKEE